MAGNQVILTFAGDSAKLEKAFDQVGQSAIQLGQQIGTTEAAFDTAVRSSSRFGAALDKLQGFGAQVGDGLDGVAAATSAVTDVMTYADRSADRLARAHVDVAQAAADVEQAMLDMRQATRDATQSGLDSEQAAIDLKQALLDQATAQQEYNAAVKEHGANSAEAKQAALDLSQAQLDAKQAQEDAKQATEDLSQAHLDAKQAQIDSADAGIRLRESQREVAAASSAMTRVGDWAGMLSGVLTGLVGIIGAVTAVQWAWNIALSANPIGLVVLGIAALIAVVVLIATKTTWFQDLWSWTWSKIGDPVKAAWDLIKRSAESLWKQLAALPGRIRSALRTLADIITWPFKTAFNAVARLWNNTVGRISFTVPDWIPGLGGNGFSMPNIPVFHKGGIMPGAPGQEGLALLEAGERITPAGQSAAPVVIELRSDGSDLMNLLIQLIMRALRSRPDLRVAVKAAVT